MAVRTKKQLPLFAIICLVVLILYMLSLALPIVWVLYTSLKDVTYIRSEPVFPTFPLYFESYLNAFTEFKTADGIGFETMLLNSLAYSLGCALVQTSVTCVTAYTTSRFNFKFDKVIYGTVIVTMILPIIGSLPSELAIADALGLLDKMYGMFIMKAHFLGMYYLVFHAMFRGIPKDFDEAAYMDGANNFVIFFKIILPIASGTYLTIVLINFINYWNDYTAPLIYMPSYPTVALGLYDFMIATSGPKTGLNVKLAACMLVFIPNFTIFLIFRNKLLGNISMGGLKE